jgi:rhodanese-related sulfurtransferase
MKLTYALVVALALAGGAAAATAGEDCGGCCSGKKGGTVAQVEIQYIDTEKLAKCLSESKEKKLTVVDVNSAERFAKGHIPGAKHAEKDALAKVLPEDKGAAIVFYCGSEKCPASHAAAKKAIELGYTNVFVYKPGIAGWEAAKQATEAGTPS